MMTLWPNDKTGTGLSKLEHVLSLIVRIIKQALCQDSTSDYSAFN